MNSLPLADNLKDEFHKVVLATQVQNAPDFIKAKNVLFKIAMDSKEGTLIVASTLRAVFVGAYNRAVEGSNVNLNKSSSIEEFPSKERPVPFNNCLEGLGALLKVSTWSFFVLYVLTSCTIYSVTF
ncbi:hypothetical protein [Lysinibacillus fusiformis]|uniref:hypothetical protein n=1 Tax=Lysinibacillus fusiformis TaxID=28031 RepID=UPI003558EC8C